MATSSAPAASVGPTAWSAAAPSSAERAHTPARLVGALSTAYAKRAQGDEEAARAELDRIVSALVQGGFAAGPGMGDLEGFVVGSQTKAGYTLPTGPTAGTWFFDLATGEPFAFVPALFLRPGPPLDGSYFVVEHDESRALYDPLRGVTAVFPGDLVAVHPDGHHVYLIGQGCRVHEWRLAEARATRTLAPHRDRVLPDPRMLDVRCHANGFRDAAVTADGQWLISRWGRWNLATGALRPLPFRWSYDGDFEPAIGPDGRHVARLMVNPAVKPEDAGYLAEATLLEIHDLELGTTTRRALGLITNSDPLSFGTHPLRVCVRNYVVYAFAVPSLQEIPYSGVHQTCADGFPLPASEHPELLAKLASRVCAMGGLLLPVEHCPPR